MSARVRAGLMVLALAGSLLAGCTQTVSGNPVAATIPPSGSSASTASPPHTALPPSATPPGARLACPRIVDPNSHLSYSCAVAGMSRGSGGIWPLEFEKSVDTDWTLDEGSGRVPLPPGHSTALIANGVAGQMEADNYGLSPTVKKERDAAITVDGKRAHLVQALITLNPAFRQERGLKVAQERLWIVVIALSASEGAAWYVSVPDVRKQVWPTVPDLIKGIKVL